mgnify:CR=1 FL=1
MAVSNSSDVKSMASTYACITCKGHVGAHQDERRLDVSCHRMQHPASGFANYP